MGIDKEPIYSRTQYVLYNYVYFFLNNRKCTTFFDPEVHLACYSLNNSGFSCACGDSQIFEDGFMPNPE